MAEPSPFDLTVAAYDATADVYAQWIGTEISSAIEAPLDRAMLEAFAEQIASAAPGQIADIGCGTGRATAYLDRRGLRVVGIDPSAGMLAVARTAHPRLDFRLGALAELPLRDAEVVGAVCWYSIIHTAAADLPPALGELARVIAPGGQLLLAFQSGGGEAVQRTSVQGRTVSLTNHRHDPDVVAECLGGAGFHVHTRAVRDAVGAHESTPQAFLMADRLPDLAA